MQRSGEAEVLGVEAGGAAVEPARGSRTLEVRWIQRGGVPAAMIERFGPFADGIEQREDRYLIDPWLPELGVKIKGAIQLDLKAYRGSPGELLVAGSGRGRLEVWEKWSYPLDPWALPPSDAPGWLALRKVRRRRSFLLAEGRVAERPLSEAEWPGCSVELTAVAVGDDVWWTLGFEAGGRPEALEQYLFATADFLFHDALPEGLELDPRDSMSYARWLGSQRDVRWWEGAESSPGLVARARAVRPAYGTGDNTAREPAVG
jgi:hypothetical protein